MTKEQEQIIAHVSGLRNTEAITADEGLRRIWEQITLDNLSKSIDEESIKIMAAALKCYLH